MTKPSKGTGGVRANVDIICVIDISGLMFGQKVALVRNTIRYVVEIQIGCRLLSIITKELGFALLNSSIQTISQPLKESLVSSKLLEVILC